MALVDIFLDIDGIKGESQDSKHKDMIEISSYSFGESQFSSRASGGGGGSGKVQMQDFHFTTRLSVASPNLMLACASGRHIKLATLTARKAGQNQQDYYKVTFTDCLISSYQTSASEASNDVPREQFSLNFSKIQLEYRPQRQDGSLGDPVTAGWDVKNNQEF
jgi:type VI secretion system secreted protein Hcp